MMPKLRNMTSLYLTCGNKILLLYRQGSRVANNLWVASAGGHFEPNELNEPEKCALRELREELGLTQNEIENLELRYITLRKINGEIRQNYFFFAELANGTELVLKSNEGILKWYELDGLKELPMPNSARLVIDHYVGAGRFNDKLYCIASNENDVMISELAEM